MYDGIVLARDGRNLMSSNTDGFHSFAVGAGPTVVRARLSFMGDDVANIHNRVGLVLAPSAAAPGAPLALSIVDVGDTPTPRLDPYNPARALAAARPGDVLKVTSGGGTPRGGAPGGALVIQSIAWDTTPATVAAARAAVAAKGGVPVDPRGIGVWAVVFAPPKVNDIRAGDITQFDKYSGIGARVTDSAFSDAYDGVFRLQGSDAFVANCSWARTATGMSITYDPDWLEGASDIENVAVKDSTFWLVGSATRVDEVFAVSPTVRNFTESGNSIAPPEAQL